jgi:hypothetical protein
MIFPFFVLRPQSNHFILSKHEVNLNNILKILEVIFLSPSKKYIRKNNHWIPFRQTYETHKYTL